MLMWSQLTCKGSSLWIRQGFLFLVSRMNSDRCSQASRSKRISSNPSDAHKDLPRTSRHLEDDTELALADLLAQTDIGGVDLPLAHDRLFQRLHIEDLVVHQPAVRVPNLHIMRSSSAVQIMCSHLNSACACNMSAYTSAVMSADLRLPGAHELSHSSVHNSKSAMSHLAAILLQQSNDLHVIAPHCILWVEKLHRHMASQAVHFLMHPSAGYLMMAQVQNGLLTARGVRPNLSTGDGGTRSTFSSHLQTW